MKAAVQKAIHVVDIEEVPEPVTKPDQIKVKIAYAGICGTDMEILEGSFHGVFQSPYFLWRANKMLSVLDLGPLVSHVYALDDINQAFADQRAGKVMKALVRP